MDPEQPAVPIRKLLLFGNPGTGKTSIGKKIANNWAHGSWGAQFKVVYLLTMRSLNKGRFSDNANVLAQETLQCAIARLCYGTIPQDEAFKVLLKHIEDYLGQEER